MIDTWYCGPRFMHEAYLILVHLLFGDLASIFPADSFDCLELIWMIFLEERLSCLAPYLASCLEAVLYSLRNLMSLMILISLVALAPILEALEALATLATLAAVCTPLPPVSNSVIQTRSKSMVRVEIRSSQK
jgi:hypothetical protein